jgi:hypothetical protein
MNTDGLFVFLSVSISVHPWLKKHGQPRELSNGGIAVKLWLMRARFHFIRRHQWRTLTSLVIVSGGLSVWWLSRELKPVVAWAGRRAGVTVSVDSARLGWRTLRVRNLSLAQPGAAEPFARVNFLEVDWRWLELARGRVAQVNVQGPALSLRGLEQFQNSRGINAGPARPAPRPQSPPVAAGSDGKGGFRLAIDALIVRDGTLTLDNLGAGLPAIPIDIAAVDPLVVNNLVLGADGDGPGAQADQTVSVTNLVVNSPYDPLTAVLKFEQIALTFNWAGLQRQHIKSLMVKNPTVYIGPDLFFFADQVQAAKSPAATPADGAPAAPWTLDYFRLHGGRLVVYALGKPGFPLPMIFSAESERMVLDNFADLPFNKLGFDIPPTDLEYAGCGLKIRQLSGALFVGLPLTDPRAQNLTPNLEIEEVAWKGVTARHLKTFMTFSRDSIITKLWAAAERPDARPGEYNLEAGVYVNLHDFSWAGWGAVDRVPLGHLTRMLSPENVIMDGCATGNFIVRGKLSEVTGMGATLTLDGAGQIKIVAVEEALRKLPGDWWQPKRAAVKALLEAFENYDYAGGGAEFTYAPPESFLRLSVDGRQGKRSFDLRWHDLRAQPGLGF